MVGIAMPPMQRVEVAGSMGGMDRHPGEARLFQIVDARGAQPICQRWIHGGFSRPRDERSESRGSIYRKPRSILWSFAPPDVMVNGWHDLCVGENTMSDDPRVPTGDWVTASPSHNRAPDALSEPAAD